MSTPNPSSSPPLPPQAPPNTIYKPTLDTYNQWAPTYDTDGNFLQALDSTLVPALLGKITPHLPPHPQLVDLGCGTGRTTLLLLEIPDAAILGLDNSVPMLERAESRCQRAWEALPRGQRATEWRFEVWDLQSRSRDASHGVAEEKGKEQRRNPLAAEDGDAVCST
ncbi:MAG: hypothetical protein Q9196_005309, partial [Gyalolechia fulgens]